ncbi:GNAT family N-acetyltransferase [Blautia sp.]
MTYIEKKISYTDYVRLREGVNWNNFNKEQTEKCLKNTLYSIEVIDNNTIIGMGRLIGDGMYYMMVDIIVEPSYQGKGIGSNIVDKLIEYVHRETPIGGRSSIIMAQLSRQKFNIFIMN